MPLYSFEDAHAYFFSNRYGVKLLCLTEDPCLWPYERIYNTDSTCPGCVEMLARRVEVCMEEG